MNVRFFDEKRADERSPIWRLEVVSRLYFPELIDVCETHGAANLEYMQWMLDVQSQLLRVGKDIAKRQAIFDGYREDLRKQHTAILRSIAAIDGTAPAVMREIVGI